MNIFLFYWCSSQRTTWELWLLTDWVFVNNFRKTQPVQKIITWTRLVFFVTIILLFIFKHESDFLIVYILFIFILSRSCSQASVRWIRWRRARSIDRVITRLDTMKVNWSNYQAQAQLSIPLGSSIFLWTSSWILDKFFGWGCWSLLMISKRFLKRAWFWCPQILFLLCLITSSYF